MRCVTLRLANAAPVPAMLAVLALAMPVRVRLSAADADFVLGLGVAAAASDGKFSVPVIADAPRAYQGFSLTVGYDPALVRIDAFDSAKTILGAIHADFVEGNAYPELGLFTIGVLADALPPFDGLLIPAVGFPLDMVQVTGQILRTEAGEIRLDVLAGGERPRVPPLFAVDNLPVRATQTPTGVIRVETGAATPAFIRGDANLDASLDIGDALTIFGALFQDAGPLGCLDAADANGDDGLDLSDGVYVLHYLFLDGARPMPPGPLPGVDFRPKGVLDCRSPLFFMPRG